MPNNSYENTSRDAKPESMTCSICGKIAPCGGHKIGGSWEEDRPKKTELTELGEQNKVLAHEKWILGQEKSQLYDQLKQLES